jgi:hypothetical protein
LHDYTSTANACFILAAMTLYEMPPQSPYQRPFRIFAGAAIIVLLVILCIAIWTPAGLSDEKRKILGWVAAAIVVAAVGVGNRLGFKEGLWKLKVGHRVEISDGKVIQRRPGEPIVEIPVDQIASLRQSRGGWLIIRGGEPERQVAVPSELVGFESLKRELSANRTVSPLKVKFSAWLFLPSASFLLACFFLLTSHNRVVVVAAGGAALLLQGFSIYSLRRRMQSNRKAKFIALMTYIVVFLILAWIVYDRARSRL